MKRNRVGRGIALQIAVQLVLERSELRVGGKETVNDGQKELGGRGVVMNPRFVKKNTERVQSWERHGRSEEGGELLEIRQSGEVLKCHGRKN